VKTRSIHRSTAAVALAAILLVSLVFLLYSLFQTYQSAIDYQRQIDGLVDQWHRLQAEDLTRYESFETAVLSFESNIHWFLEGDVLHTLGRVYPDLERLAERTLIAWHDVQEGYSGRWSPLASYNEERLEVHLGQLNRWFDIYSRSQRRALGQMYTLLGMATLLAGGLLVVTTLTMGREQAARESAQRQLRTVLEVQEEERRRIAQDLHDDLAQEIVSADKALSLFGDRIEMTDPDSITRIGEIRGMLEGTLETIRTIAHGLRPVQLEHFGVGPAIENFCRDTERALGVRIDFSAVGLRSIRLSEQTEINLFRVVQEALSNATRLAEADRISVRLVSSDPWLIARIEDNGKGFNLRDSVTERNIRERMALLGGRVRIRSGGKGSIVEVRVPLGSRGSDA
jgi:signal transduction histidine kinase